MYTAGRVAGLVMVVVVPLIHIGRPQRVFVSWYHYPMTTKHHEESCESVEEMQ